MAYADITIFVMTPTDIPVIQETIHFYEKAMGAHLNTRKSRALAVGGWSTNKKFLNIPYQTRHHFHEHRRAINEQVLGDRNGQGQSTDNGNIQKGGMPLAAHQIRANLSPS